MSYTAKTPEEIKQEEIKEHESQVKICDAGIILSSDLDTAMAIKIALGGNNFFEIWVDDNSKIKELIQHERQLALNHIIDLQNS